MEDNQKYKQLYIIAELRYIEDNKDIDSDNLFPIGWYINGDYKLKIMILSEAIKKHILITGTDLYINNFIERVK